MHFKTKQEAQTRAEEVQRMMGDKGSMWKIHVHENGGWHFCLHYKNVSVHGGRKPGDTFYALIGDKIPEDGKYMGGGLAMWTPNSDNRKFFSPQDAVNAAIQGVRNCMKKLNEAAEAADEAWFD
jgi:hypothetical protein